MNMIPRSKSIFSIDGGGDYYGDQKLGSVKMDYSMRLVGLRILIDRAQNTPNVLTKSALKMNISTHQRHPESGFLKVCYLCSKDLSPDKDVYMYRGDQGFCSVTCRQKQITIDERRDRGVFKWDRPVPVNSPGAGKANGSKNPATREESQLRHNKYNHMYRLANSI